MTGYNAQNAVLKLITAVEWARKAAMAAEDPDALAAFVYGVKDSLTKATGSGEVNLAKVDFRLLFDQLHDTPDKLYSVEEVAAMLHVKARQTIYGFIRDGRLNAYMIGKKYRILRSEIERFMEAVSVSKRGRNGQR